MSDNPTTPPERLLSEADWAALQEQRLLGAAAQPSSPPPGYRPPPAPVDPFYKRFKRAIERHPYRASAIAILSVFLVTFTIGQLPDSEPAPVRLVSAPPSSVLAARDYGVRHCQDLNPEPDPLTDWLPDSNVPRRDQASQDCSRSRDGALRLDWSEPDGRRAAGESSSWTLTAPPSLRFVSWKVEGVVDTAGVSNSKVSWSGVTRCATGDSGSKGADKKCDRKAVTASKPIDRSTLNFTLACVGATGPKSGSKTGCKGSGLASMRKSLVVVRDLAIPAVASATGPLLATRPDKPLVRSKSVDIRAADSGSGASFAELWVDGTRKVAGSPQCAPPYRSITPCPEALNTELKLDADGIKPGLHRLDVVVSDASGNRRIAATDTLYVGGRDTISEASSTAARGAANGNPREGTPEVVLSWRRRPDGSVGSREDDPCVLDSKAAGHSGDQCAGVVRRGEFITPIDGPASAPLVGLLRDSAGRPIAKARVDLIGFPSRVAAKNADLGSVTTDRYGRFSVAVPVGEGSAKIVAAYRPRENDSLPVSATATLTTTERTSILAPATAVAGGSVLIRGGLTGETGILVNTPVVVESYANGDWKVIATDRTDDDGRWGIKFAVSKDARNKLLVRARAKRTNVRPYLPTPSAPVEIRIRKEQQ